MFNGSNGKEIIDFLNEHTEHQWEIVPREHLDEYGFLDIKNEKDIDTRMLCRNTWILVHSSDHIQLMMNETFVKNWSKT